MPGPAVAASTSLGQGATPYLTFSHPLAPSWPGVDPHLLEDLAIDQEMGEALISDYFTGVIWLQV